MKVFFGSAIQGASDRGMRAAVNTEILNTIKACGHTALAEHTTGQNKEEVSRLLEEAIGPLPPPGIHRTRYVCHKMLGLVELRDLGAAIFEVSVPSTGTGIEIDRALLRPRVGLSTVPILFLYEEEYWSSGLSSMVKGLPFERMPGVELVEYAKGAPLKPIVQSFLADAEGK